MSELKLTVTPITEEAAHGQVAEIYEDIKQTKQIDFIPRFWQTLATQPALLESTWTALKRWMHPESVSETSNLDAKTREMIALAVSATNGCTYCIQSHTAALAKLGMNEEAVGEGMAIAGLFNQTNALAHGYQIAPDVLPNWDGAEESSDDSNV